MESKEHMPLEEAEPENLFFDQDQDITEEENDDSSESLSKEEDGFTAQNEEDSKEEIEDLFDEESETKEPEAAKENSSPTTSPSDSFPSLSFSSPVPPVIAQSMEAGARMFEKQRREAEYVRFVEEFPDMRDYEKEIPESVWARVRAGENLTAAYRAFRLDQAELELSALRNQRKNQSRSSGSAVGDAATEEGDAFLEGFLG